MKKASMRKFSILGLVLIGASAVTAAVLPKSEPRKIGPGALVDSTTPTAAGQKTCIQQTGANQCTWTATDGVNSTTSAADKNTSTLTVEGGAKIATNTVGAGKQSSQSPN